MENNRKILLLTTIENNIYWICLIECKWRLNWCTCGVCTSFSFICSQNAFVMINRKKKKKTLQCAIVAHHNPLNDDAIENLLLKFDCIQHLIISCGISGLFSMCIWWIMNWWTLNSKNDNNIFIKYKWFCSVNPSWKIKKLDEAWISLK